MSDKYPKQKIIFLDTETTGLDYTTDRIIQLACVKVESMSYDGEWLDNPVTWESYFNVDVTISDDAFRVHGISNDFLADKTKFTDKMPDFLDFIGDYTIIAHNANFDINFLNHELQLSKHKMISNPVIDSIDVAKERYPGQAVNLDALMKKFGIPKRAEHSAIDDAIILAKVYFMMITDDNNQLFEHHEADDFSGYKFCERLL